MPWKEHRILELREEFVLRAKGPNANVAELCREYQVSRKTAYKWLARFEQGGVAALRDMSRRPLRVTGTDGEVVLRIAEMRAAHPSWGPKKIRILLLRERSRAPSVKTIGRVLARLGEPTLRRPRQRNVTDRGVPKHDVQAANDLWTVDFKGWWKTRDGKRCEPLTVRDAFSRFVLCVKVLSSTALAQVRPVFQRLFEEHGLPRSIHVDNGAPFGSTSARAGLSKLSAWWVAVGIEVVFSRPGHPQDNGAHERMHGDMSLELERNASASVAAQQRACDRWVDEFNHVRPHEALNMKTPASLFRRSTRRYAGQKAPRYPISFTVRTVPKNGSLKYNRREFYVGAGFAGHTIGIEHLEASVIKLWFFDVDLGVVDLSKARPTRGESQVFIEAPPRQKPARASAREREPIAYRRRRPRLAPAQWSETETSNASKVTPEPTTAKTAQPTSKGSQRAKKT